MSEIKFKEEVNMKEAVKKLEKFGTASFKDFYIDKKNGGYFVFTGSHATLKNFYLSLDELEQMGQQILELVEEIKNRDKFSIRDLYYFVREDGAIEDDIYTGHAVDFCRMISGNIFRTKEEAKERAVEILATFEEARKKYVRI